MEIEKELATSSHFPDSFYRVSIKGLHVKDGKVLLAYDTTGMRDYKRFSAWELPGGGMDFGETFEEALRREVQEEMGVEVSWVAAKPLYAWTWEKRGSKGMDWYYALLLAFPMELKSIDIVPTDECVKVQFFSKEELQNLKLDDQLESFRKIFDPADFV